MYRTNFVLPILCAALLMPGVACAADSVEGVVRYVIDGDTVMLQPAGSRPIKLRLIGLDAPEICQAGGAAARDALAGRVIGRLLRADGAISDDYQRRLVKLTLDGEDIGAWMVSRGHAWNVSYRGRRGLYASEEAAARAAQRGVFAEPGALAPRSFRRMHGSCYPTHAP